MSRRRCFRGAYGHANDRRSVIARGFAPSLATLGLWALGFSFACASNGPLESATPPARSVGDVLADAPPWVTSGCRTYWSDAVKRRQVVCGIGSAVSNRNRVAARETAIARARSVIARSLEVTIESLVRLEERETGDSDLETISHQLSSTSLRGVQLESVWRAETGEVHALVSLDLDRVQKTVRSSHSLSPTAREDLARRAADAFAALDAAFAEQSAQTHDESRD